MKKSFTTSRTKKKHWFANFQLLVLVFLGVFSVAKSQTAPSEIADSLQAILNRALPQGVQNPGAVMSVFVPGQWTWSGASGSAINGMTAGHPATTAAPTDKFRVGSITKTFIAAAILLLEEQGLLNTEDFISQYLRTSLVNDTIMSSEPVRIRHLLNHTSGIDNSANNTSCQQNALADLSASHTLEEAIYCGASQGEIFPPEFAWAYSNTNYSILAMIIEEVSGQNSMDYIYHHIIAPLGLSETEIPTTDEISAPHMGCYWNIGNLIDMTIVDASLYWGWADIVSTTTDLNRFYYALLNGQLINQTSLNKMMTMYPGTYDYGLGLDFYGIGSSGVPYFGHTGEVGNSSSMWYANNVTTAFPNGYFISYNFNYQGVDMWPAIDEPVYNLMNSFVTKINNLSNNEPEVSVYPNPAQEELNIEIQTIDGDKGTITIYDLAGQMILQSMIELHTGSNHFKISLADLTDGIYCYEFRSGKGISKGRITKTY